MSWFFESAPPRKKQFELTPELESQFFILFGEKPLNRPANKQQRAAWDYAYRYFEGLELPEVSQRAIERAADQFEEYDIPIPTFFKQRGRVLARFEGSPIDVNPDARSVALYPVHYIAAKQVDFIKAGEFVENVHPFVPGKYTKLNAENKPE